MRKEKVAEDSGNNCRYGRPDRLASAEHLAGVVEVHHETNLRKCAETHQVVESSLDFEIVLRDRIYRNHVVATGQLEEQRGTTEDDRYWIPETGHE